MLRSIGCFMLALAIARLSHGQMSRAQAERFIDNSSGAVPVNRDDRIWGLTSSDVELIAALKNPTTDRASVAVWETTRRKHPALVAALIDALPRADKTVGVYIIGSFTEISTPATQAAVKKATSHKVSEVRWAAAALSARWGYKGAQKALAEAVKKDQAFALPGLGKVGSPRDIPVIKGFHKRALKRKYPGYGPVETNMAIYAMGSLRDTWALTKLRTEMDWPRNIDFREGAIETLGPLKVQEDVNRFIHALQDPEPRIRLAAVEALGKSGSKKAIVALRKFAEGERKGLATAALNEARGKKYASYVADCLSSDKVPMSQRDWNLKNPLYPVS